MEIMAMTIPAIWVHLTRPSLVGFTRIALPCLALGWRLAFDRALTINAEVEKFGKFTFLPAFCLARVRIWRKGGLVACKTFRITTVIQKICALFGGSETGFDRIMALFYSA